MRYLFPAIFKVLIFFSIPALAQTNAAADSLTIPKNNEADSLVTSSIQYLKSSKLRDGFVGLMKAQEIYSKAGDKAGQFAVFKALGDFYYQNKQWSDAEGYYELAVPLIPSPDTTTVSAELQLALARINIATDKREFALEYLGNALSQFTYKGLKGRMAETQIALASIKRNQKNYYKAENIVLHYALPLVSAPADRKYRIASFDELGHIYHEWKKYSQAKWFYIQANTLARTAKDTLAIVNSLVNLGRVKTDINDLNLAIRDFKEAENLAKRGQLIQQQADVSKAFAEVYKRNGNKSLASRYSSNYSALTDSLKNMQAARESEILKAKSEAGQIVNPPKGEVASEKPAEKSNTIYFLGAFAVIVLLAGLLFYLRRKK